MRGKFNHFRKENKHKTIYLDHQIKQPISAQQGPAVNTGKLKSS